MPKTPQATVTAAITYLASNLPPAGDPRYIIHNSMIAGFGLIESTLHEEAAAEPKKKATVKFTRSRTPSSDEAEHDLPRCRHSTQRRSHNDNARSELTQHKIDKSREKSACSMESEDQDTELCGAR